MDSNGSISTDGLWYPIEISVVNWVCSKLGEVEELGIEGDARLKLWSRGGHVVVKGCFMGFARNHNVSVEYSSL